MDLYFTSSRQGFTLIEILIVLAISASMTGMVIVYSAASRDTVSLSVKTTEVAQSILRAKSLAVSTYSVTGQQRVCAYGVAFDPSANTFSMVSYVPPSGTSCSEANSVTGDEIISYGPSTWQMPIGPGVRLTTGGASLVLFYPPDPTTLLSGSSCVPGGDCTYTFLQVPMTVTFATTGGTSGAVTIGAAGQVDVQ